MFCGIKRVAFLFLLLVICRIKFLFYSNATLKFEKEIIELNDNNKIGSLKEKLGEITKKGWKENKILMKNKY